MTTTCFDGRRSGSWQTLLLLPLGATIVAGTPAELRVPQWEPTYEMWRSTIVMPCNISGFMDLEFVSKWGIVDIDWSNTKRLWQNEHPMNCQEMLVDQVKKIKDVSPKTHVWVYRNLVKALPWYTDVREKISDPRYAGWFLRFRGSLQDDYQVPPCTAGKCSELYHDQLQTPVHCDAPGCDCGAVPCGEYLWDHRNSSLSDWLVDEFAMGPTGVGHSLIDGLYLDDQWTDSPGVGGFCNADAIGGAMEEHANCTVDMGLAQEDTTALTAGWRETNDKVNEAVVAAGGFAWHLFHEVKGAPAPGSSCEAFFERACSADSPEQTGALMLEFSQPKVRPLVDWKRDLATFLLVRGPYAWIGYAWIGCTSAGAEEIHWPRPAALDEDYGEPHGLCSETSPGSGVYERQWTKARVAMDCATGEATIEKLGGEAILI